MTTLMFTFTVFSYIINENFNTLDTWVHSNWHEASSTFTLGHGKYRDESNENSLLTNESARYYTMTNKFDPFSNNNMGVFLQYYIQNSQNIDCGGMYVKLYPELESLSDVKGGEFETPYNIMFGPDKCGSTSKVHFIFNFNKSNVQKREDIPMPYDSLSHLYTFGLMPKGMYFVNIDGSTKTTGNIHDDWKFLKDKKIPDPSVKKPIDWVEDEYIDDENDVKPEGWDDVPKNIPDPDATKPDDWDDEDDGIWEPPVIDNPEFKGEWRPKTVKNSEYKGKWVPSMISNPEYEYSDTPGNYTFGAIGFEIWSATTLTNLAQA